MRWSMQSVDNGPIVYRLGRHSFKVQRRVRLPLGLLSSRQAVDGWSLQRRTIRLRDARARRSKQVQVMV